MTRAYSIGGRTGALVAIALVALLSGYLLYPALFLDRSLVHEDNLHHGYALLKFHHDVIHQGLSPLWTNLVYGGHPLFAEGQAGLSNPVNYLVAWLFKPEFGHNFIHWLSMVLFGAGCYGLARCLAIRPIAAIIATLAATFSGLTLHSNSNMMGISAMAWIPWALWAFESWLKDPRMSRAIIFGLSVSMLVFSGYPQFLHGTVVYMAASLLTLPAESGIPALIRRYWRSALVAIGVCVAISSIQWMPLLELASQSHRKDGIEILGNGTPSYLLQGLLYAIDSATGEQFNAYFPNTSSMIVCFFALLVLTLPSSLRIKGHIIATALLLNMGLGDGSPVYSFAKTYHIIPGMGNFRISFPYFMPSLVGIAVLAACSVDALSRLDSSAARNWSRSWRLVITVLFFCVIVYLLHNSVAPVTHYIILGAGLLVLFCLVAWNRMDLLGWSICFLVLTEIAILKITPIKTVENSLVTTPPALAVHILSQPDFMDYKHYHSGLVALSFTNPYSSKLKDKASHELNNLVASTNLLWGIPSFSAALALKSHRKPIANAVVANDMAGYNDRLGDQRLMDVLSIKWISKKNPETSRHLAPVRIASGRTIAWENPQARPTIQVYHDAQQVDGPEAAAEAIERYGASTLYFEGPAAAQSVPSPSEPGSAVELTKQVISPTNYKFAARSGSGFWLFMADTYHPGWKATIGGESTPVYPAQVLGKAIYVPAGQHEVRIYFQSSAFRIGAAISSLALLTLLAYGAFRIRDRLSRRV